MVAGRTTERIAGAATPDAPWWRTGSATAVAFWLLACAFWLSNVRLFNDHFDRISRARQVARYGELPFRDFFDPGYFMAEMASAGLQLLLGDSLLAEVLLNTALMAGGATVVLLLARRASASTAVAVAAGLVALLAMPRAYDYDKVFFYPLGVLLVWRYIDRPTLTNVLFLSAGMVLAASFRYDTGVYIAATAAAGIAVFHGLGWRQTMRDLAAVVAASLVLASPIAIFVQTHGGIGTAIDQVVTYGVRETELGHVLVFDPPPPPNNIVHVRWAPAVDEEGRARLAATYSLHNGSPEGEAANRTWSYELDDDSTENIQRLIGDPAVEDTHLIDRGRLALMPEDTRTRLLRALPILRAHVRPDLFETPAAGALYLLLLALPFVALIAGGLSRDVRTDAAARARLISLVVMCLAMNVFILRAPIEARIGGLIGPAAVLGAWMAGRLRWSPSRASRWAFGCAGGLALAVAIWGIGTAADWRRSPPELPTWSRVQLTLQTMSAVPPDLGTLPDPRIAGVVQYLRECTAPDDRVYAAWFAPEVSFFAQRAAAGGMIATFGVHWSEPRYQRGIVERLQRESVPVVLLDRRRSPDLRQHYPLVQQHLDANYEVAGETDFGDSDNGPYVVLARRDRRPVRLHESSMPCYWGG